MTTSSSRTLRLPLPIRLGLAWRQFGVGARDPSLRRFTDEALRASMTPDGPVTLHVRVDPRAGECGEASAEAWGPGRHWILDRLPDLLGAHDDLTDWYPDRHEVVARYARRDRGTRIVRGGRVEDVLFLTILGQKVTGFEAARGWHTLLRAHGTPAPGPGGMVVPPTAEVLQQLPDWEYRRAGVELARSRRIRTAAERIVWLEEATTMSPDEALARLTALPGLGIWTASVVQRMALGDADAIEVGDYHIPDIVAWNLAGEDRADDDRMEELLEPFRPHRGRALLLILHHGRGKPAYGARMSPGTLSSAAYRDTARDVSRHHAGRRQR